MTYLIPAIILIALLYGAGLCIIKEYQWDKEQDSMERYMTNPHGEEE